MMIPKNYTYALLILMLIVAGCKDDEPAPSLTLLSAFMGDRQLSMSSASTDLPTDRSVSLNFSVPVDRTTAATGIVLDDGGTPVAATMSFSSEDKTVVIFPESPLRSDTQYVITITDQLKGSQGQAFPALTVSFRTIKIQFNVLSVKINNAELPASGTTAKEISASPAIVVTFSETPDAATLSSSITLQNVIGESIALKMSVSQDAPTVTITVERPLQTYMRYELKMTDGVSNMQGDKLASATRAFYTGISEVNVMTTLPNDEDNDADNTNDLLSVVQQQTFKYFWDFGHPVSGMARERNSSGDVVTSGGTGFGIMALIVGMERKFITRADGLARMTKIVAFLEDADRFHGAWSHWLNGSTGEAVPFSAKDDGGDLVETSFLVQGLITFRQYLNPGVPAESALADRITVLWEEVEWDWYRKNNENVLYWHWSANFNWDMNFPMSGYFEQQVTYVLAAASPAHSVPKVVYDNGYGQNGAIVKNGSYYNHMLPLGTPSPLFWVHYSYVGMDPHFNDAYASYWQQNVNATLINQAYCVANPKGYVGYSDQCWGLTSSDNQTGYDAHSPSNDQGVITPTAALSSFPYTPDESMKALRMFYYKLGDRLWGQYGFYDAFNLTTGWTANSNLAIDQGPIIVMIENYRTGLLWELFMSAPEVKNGFTTLGFSQ